MREILFRGKRVDNGKWVYGDLIQSGEKHRPIDREDIPFSNSYIIRKTTPSYTDGCLKGCEWLLSSHAVHVDPATVGQYTGLKDKNGQRIFEGDIVRITWYAFERKPVHGIYDVVYVTCGFYVKQNDRLRGLLSSYATAKTQNCGIEIEVIGNVHDGNVEGVKVE